MFACVFFNYSASSRTRRGSRVPPRTTQSPTSATAPWAGSTEGADAAIAYATGVDDDAVEDGFCYSAVANLKPTDRNAFAAPSACA